MPDRSGRLASWCHSSSGARRCFQPRCFQSQPSQVLGQVYVSDRNLDDDLVRSISLPAQDPNAAEVFYRVITGAASCSSFHSRQPPLSTHVPERCPAAPRGALAASQRWRGFVCQGCACRGLRAVRTTCRHLSGHYHQTVPNLLLLLCAARGEAMNRLLARLDGLPLYLLWGEKVGGCLCLRDGWMAGQT